MRTVLIAAGIYTALASVHITGLAAARITRNRNRGLTQ